MKEATSAFSGGRTAGRMVCLSVQGQGLTGGCLSVGAVRSCAQCVQQVRFASGGAFLWLTAMLPNMQHQPGGRTRRMLEAKTTVEENAYA